MESSPQALQHGLVEYLLREGYIQSQAVAQAFRQVPRHLFLPAEPLDRVYSDVAIAVRREESGAWTSSSSQPAMMAIMLEQLDLRPGQRVMEIGMGTGFNAALIAAIVGERGEVISIDIQPDLVEEARQHLAEAGFSRVKALVGDGGYGYPDGAPYDRIILTVGSQVIAPAWIEQLKVGGKLVLPFGGSTQASVVFEKRGDILESTGMAECGFMRLKGDFGAPEQQRIILDTGGDLFLVAPEPLPVEVEQVRAWLDGPYEDLPSGVQASPRALRAGWFWWMSARGIELYSLVAAGDQVECSRLPALFRFGGPHPMSIAVALVDPNGLAVLACLPAGPAGAGEAKPQEPGGESSESGDASPPLLLVVRRYGEGQAAAARLLDNLREWDAAGGASLTQPRIRVIPRGVDYQPLPGEELVETPWNWVGYRFE